MDYLLCMDGCKSDTSSTKNNGEDSRLEKSLLKEDIPKLVEVLCHGDGRDGSIYGFVKLTEEDCTKIYQMMV